MGQYSLTLINGGAPLCTIQRLKARCEEALSSFALSFNWRRYSAAAKMRDHLNDVHHFGVSKSAMAQGDWICVDCGDVVAGAHTRPLPSSNLSRYDLLKPQQASSSRLNLRRLFLCNLNIAHKPCSRQTRQWTRVAHKKRLR
jgi:hypothetical protein